MSMFAASVDFPSKDLWRLVGALCDGTLTEPERDRLEVLLRSDTEAKRFAMAYLDQHARLLWRYREPNRVEQKALAERPVLTVGFGRTILRKTFNSSLAATLFVASVLYGIFGYLAWDLRTRNLQDVSPDRSVAIVRNATDVQWSPSADTKSDDSSVRAGEPLKIESGSLELELGSGTKLVIEGPADWSVDGKNRVSLRSGKLVARVPQQAIGFTIQTKSATFVDLGTEFGLEVDSQGVADLQVYRGKVELRPTERVNVKSPMPIVVEAGSARRVIPSSSGSIEINRIGFESRRLMQSMSNLSKKQTSKFLAVKQATASSSAEADRSASNLVNGCGLAGERHTNNASLMWHSAYGKVKGEFVIFDLGQPCQLSHMKVWNYNEETFENYRSRGMAQGSIYVSESGKGNPLSDKDEWQLLIADQKFSMADGTFDYDEPDVVSLRDTIGRYVAIVADDHFGPEPRGLSPAYDCVGLSEVLFFGVPVAK
jgi:hypothetical protein